MKKHIGLTVLTALILILGNIAAVQAKMTPPHGVGQIGLQAVVLCEELTVLNFGEVLAQGETSAVLADPQVITAYLGE